jgi:hypothetical protein
MALLATALTAVAPLVISLAAGVEEESHGVNPYLVGGGTLVALVALLLAVVAIGGGREHS